MVPGRKFCTRTSACATSLSGYSPSLPSVAALAEFSSVRAGTSAWLCRHQFLTLGRFRNQLTGLFVDRLLDVTELVLPEEHLLSNEETRRAECSAVNRVSGPIDQPLLDIILLRTRNQPVDIDA